MSYFFLFFLSLFFPIAAFAQNTSVDPCAGGNSDLAICKTAGLGIGGALGTVIQFLFVIAVILALGFLVYGGIRWITSGGDKAGVETARNTIIAAIIGLIVVFLAYVIINLVLIFLTGTGIGGIKIPSLNTAESLCNEADGDLAACEDSIRGASCEYDAANEDCRPIP